MLVVLVVPFGVVCSLHSIYWMIVTALVLVRVRVVLGVWRTRPESTSYQPH
jgi:hypothetical protein